MPLFILGFILLVCLLIYSIISYISSGKEIDSGTILRNRHKDDTPAQEESKTLLFPTENVETEKHKRNIH